MSEVLDWLPVLAQLVALAGTAWYARALWAAEVGRRYRILSLLGGYCFLSMPSTLFAAGTYSVTWGLILLGMCMVGFVATFALGGVPFPSTVASHRHR
ncbi:hypothetical protein J2S53_001415 [Actinopolyspora lacussalsi]|nr:hypothetical protein [Actinopolyspora lacussalsi]